MTRYYATPEPDAYAGTVGQLVMRSYALCIEAGPAAHGEPVQTGRVTYSPFYGDGQVVVTWADGSQTTVDGDRIDLLQAVRLVGVQVRAEMLAVEVVPAVLPRFERYTIAYHPSTDASEGYRRNGYADAVPAEDDRDPDSEYVDRWQIATIAGAPCACSRHTSWFTAGPVCACRCHAAGGENDFANEPPF